MRRIYIYPVFFVLLLCAGVIPAQAAKLKHRATLYPATAEQSLRFPEGVACNDGSLVIADTGNNQLVRYSLTADAMVPEAVYPLENVVPLRVQMDADGNIYVLDGKTREILILSPDGKQTGKLSAKGQPGSKTVVPRSFALSGDQTYLLDIFSERLLVLDRSGKFIHQIPFPEEARFFSDLTVGPHGNIYLLDSVAGAIYQGNPAGDSFSLFSSGLKEYMNFPTSLAVDKNGALYLSDQYGSGLAVVGRDGSFQGRKLGMGWEDGQLYYPSQVCIGAQGNLAIADRGNSRVQVFKILDE